MVSLAHAQLLARGLRHYLAIIPGYGLTVGFSAPTPSLLTLAIRIVYRCNYAPGAVSRPTIGVYISVLLRAGIRWEPSIDRALSSVKSSGHQLFTHRHPSRQVIIEEVYNILPDLRSLTVQLNTKHLQDANQQIPCDWIVRTFIMMRLLDIPGELIAYIMSYIPLLEIPLSINSYLRYVSGLYF